MEPAALKSSTRVLTAALETGTQPLSASGVGIPDSRCLRHTLPAQISVRGTEHTEARATGAEDNRRHCQSPSLSSVVLFTSALQLILPAGR